MPELSQPPAEGEEVPEGGRKPQGLCNAPYSFLRASAAMHGEGWGRQRCTPKISNSKGVGVGAAR